MNCDVDDDALLEYILGHLAEPMRQEIEQHIAGGCAKCNANVARWRETLGQLPSSLVPVEPPEHVTGQLLRRIRDDLRARAQPVSPARRSTYAPRRAGWEVLLNVCATLLVAVCSYQVLQSFVELRRERAALRVSELEAIPRVNGLGVRSGKADSILDSRGLRFVAFRTEPSRPEVRGHLIWDESTSQFHFFAMHLDPPRDEQSYALWLLDTDDAISDPIVVEVNEERFASLVVDVPPNLKPLARVVLTLEESAPTGRPRGTILLSAELK
jgi:anti-sigma-K factor RskA